ncbi:MAG: AsmA family protein [Bacteroidales bacterium]|nr:AsmA family protein [Candidatus Colimorpha onthohippi]
MKKWIKITLISLGSLVALLLVVFAVACWLIFTPAQLTKIVNNLSNRYVTCDTHFGSVNLTLFKTFPDAGVDIHDVWMVNPIQGAPSDTVAYIHDLVVGVDIREFIKNGNIVVRKICLDGVDANLFTSSEGQHNFDVIALADSSQLSDTTAFRLPEEVSLNSIKLDKVNGSYTDNQLGVRASLEDLEMDLSGSLLGESIDASLLMNIKKICYTQQDSVGADFIDCEASDVSVDVSSDGSFNNLQGRLQLSLPKGQFSMQGVAYVNDALASSSDDLLSIDIPFNYSNGSLSVDGAQLGLDQLKLSLTGRLQASSDVSYPSLLDADFSVSKVSVQDLLPYLPPQFAGFCSNMTIKGDVALSGHVEGGVGDTNVNVSYIGCDLMVQDGSFADMSMLPKPLRNISADVSAQLYLDSSATSVVNVRGLSATMGSSKVNLEGSLSDVLGQMNLDVRGTGSLQMVDVMSFIPDTMPLDVRGTAQLKLSAKATIDQLSQLDLNHIKLESNIDFNQLDVAYGDIHAISPALHLNLHTSAQRPVADKHCVVAAALLSDNLQLKMPSNQVDAKLTGTQLAVNLPDFSNLDKPIAAAFKLVMERTNVGVDSIGMDAEQLELNGSVRYDASQNDLIASINPNLSVTLGRTLFFMPDMPEALRMSSMAFDYKPGSCRLNDFNLHWGESDYHLSGSVLNLEDWLAHKSVLKADISLQSNYSDIDQLLSLISGMGSDPDTIEQMRREDDVPADAAPFIVPRDVDVTLHTNVKSCVAFDNKLSNLAGNISIRDGKAILDQVGFVCKAARMQLTGIYKSPRPNHLYLGVDFHLLDIDIEELIDMIPYVDTLVPMLSSFSGQANFHLALEGYLDAKYAPKTSTLLGSAAISGKELVVLDNETFDKISSLLMFKRSTRNVIDSLDVEMTLFRNKMEVYPFLFSMDKYQVCASGIHSLTGNYNYHVELLKSPLPLRLAVDVKGTMPNIGISLGKVVYNELYNPAKQDAIKQRTLEIKKMVREALESNVR